MLGFCNEARSMISVNSMTYSKFLVFLNITSVYDKNMVFGFYGIFFFF